VTTIHQMTETPASVDTEFEVCVREVLANHQLDNPGLRDADVDAITDAIMADYRPRIDYQRGLVSGLREQILQLIGRDRAHHHHMAQVQENTTAHMTSRDRYALQTRQLAEQLGEVSRAVRKAAGVGAHMVAIGELTAILQTPRQVPRQQGPVVLSLVPDSRWTAGVFIQPDGGTQVFAMLGWSVVFRPVEADSQVEPVFLVGQHRMCQSEIHQRYLLALKDLV
jgi:hypothetical protein